MSEQNPAPAAPAAAPAPSADQKIAELTTQLQTLNQSFDQRMADIQALIATSRQPVAVPAAPEAPLDPYQPDYTDKLAAKLEERITRQVEQRERATLDRQVALTELTADYPELNNPQSDLTKTAAKILSTLEPHMQKSSIGYKLAVREAAAQAGVLPKSKRPQSDESFSLGVSNAPAQGARRSKDGEVSDQTKAFAQAMGMNVNDEALMKRLAARSQRKFNEWGE